LCKWINKKEELAKASPKTFKLHKSKSSHFSQIEEHLSNWIIEQYQLQNIITQDMITAKTVSLIRHTNFQYLPNIQSFKFLCTWLDRNIDKTPLTFDLPNSTTIDK
ncbi:27953_t:CDS:2, partial [Dentiscutata erythropus]